MTRTWLFHSNPQQYDVLGAVRAGALGGNWSARQHRDEISSGDRAALYISSGLAGYSAGVFAIGTVRSAVWEGIVDPRFWIGAQPGPTEFVDVDFDRFVFHHPVNAAELKSDRAFLAGFPRVWQRTVIPLEDSHWQAIERRVSKRRPTSQPRTSRSMSTWNRGSPG